MRIIFVQDSLGTGGAERSNYYLWQMLKSQNIPFKIVVLEHRKVGIESQVLLEGYDVRFLKTGSVLRQVVELISIIGEFKPDIVHSVLFKASLRTRIARFFKRFQHVESLVNCTYDPIRLQDPKISRFGLWMYQQLDKITSRFGTDRYVAITEEVRRHYVTHLGIRSDLIDVIYRGRDENTFLKDRELIRQEIRSALDLEQDSIIIIHVGRQEYQKGHLTLLEAIESSDELLAERAVFVFCGRDGNSTEAIGTFLKDKKTRTKLIWLGHRADVPKLLVGSDIFVFPSLYEGLGGALIEAQAAALPVLCSDLKVFEEVVEKGKSALTFEKNSSEELASKLILMVNDDTLRKELGANGLRNFRGKFQIEEINQRVISLYQKMLN